MAIVVFVAAYTCLTASTFVYSTILVISLTYLLLPILSRIFKRWLYPGGLVKNEGFVSEVIIK
jgi:antibiotic biosynthesis monooxygenase (ABM) superfamily enzyme